MARRTTWILVADASRARLFEDQKPKGGYAEIEQFEHPDSRAKVRELMADANGRKPGGMAVMNHPAGIGRPGAAPDTDAKEVEAIKFCDELAGMLEKRLNDHAYDSLVLVAPPHFLGLLRSHVSDQVAKRIELSFDKDYTMLDAREIERRVQEQLAA